MKMPFPEGMPDSGMVEISGVLAARPGGGRCQAGLGKRGPLGRGRLCPSTGDDGAEGWIRRPGGAPPLVPPSRSGGLGSPQRLY